MKKYQSKHDPKQRRRLIIGGHDVERGRYPYFVSIDKNNGVIVNGALIAPDIVLSAGHIALDQMGNLTIKIGTYAVHEAEDFAEEIKDELWLVPSSWQQSVIGSFHDDYLILKLAEKSTHKPVKINRDKMIPLAGDRVVMAGLGWLNETVLSPASIVQEVELVTMSNEECGSISDPSRHITYEGYVDESMLCTKAPPNTVRDGCAWDSGAPVIIAGETPEEDLLVALGSSGIGCADPVFPAIQARVATDNGLAWIREQVCLLSVDPPEDFHCSIFNETPSTTTTDAAFLVPFPSLTTTDAKETGKFPVFAMAGCLFAVIVAMAVVKRVKTKYRKHIFLDNQAQTQPLTYGSIDV